MNFSRLKPISGVYLTLKPKLIRQYIPKQANFDDFTDKKMASIQKKINSRPR